MLFGPDRTKIFDKGQCLGGCDDLMAIEESGQLQKVPRGWSPSQGSISSHAGHAVFPTVLLAEIHFL